MAEPTLSLVERATALLDSIPDADPNNPEQAPPDAHIPTVGDWTEHTPPEGLEARTGHAIHKGDAEPVQAAALDWTVLYELGDPPPRQWAEAGWIGRGHVTLMAGTGGIGKTLLAQQWASCWALGRRMLGENGPPLRTLMWACEDDHDELWRRQLAIARWQRQDLRAYDNLRLVPRVGLMNALVMSEFGKPGFTPVIETLRAEAEEHRADVVILDNIAQLYGAGENDRHAVTYFVNGLTGALPGRALLLLGHPSKGIGSEFSGSTAWEAAVRARLYLGTKAPDDRSTDEPDENSRVLARRKANYSAKDMRRFTYQDGVLIPEAPEMVIDAREREDRERADILAALRGCCDAKIIVPTAATGNRTAFHVLASRPEFPAQMEIDGKAGTRRFWRVMQLMLGSGEILEQPYRRGDGHKGMQFLPR